MRDAPTGAALLWQARKTLLEDLLPALPEERHYEALMVASAMAIAAREASAGERGAEEGDVPVAALAAAIRAGERDGDVALHDLLLDDAAARLAISNPKLLPGAKR